MSMTLEPGTRLFSAVCSTEMITVRAPDDPVEITIGGEPPVADAADRPESASAHDGHDEGTAIGKRYVDEAGTVELLCTKPGDGVPAMDGEVLQLKDAKPLPSSD